MKNTTTYFNLLLGALFCFFLWWYADTTIAPQLCQKEQESLLSLDWSTFVENCIPVGGFSQWLSLFGIQFFFLPHVGSLVFISPLFFLLLSYLVLLKRTGTDISWMAISGMSIVALLFSAFDYYYNWWGLVSMAVAMLFLAWVSLLPRGLVRQVAFVILVPLVFWLCGSAALAYLLGGIALFTQGKLVHQFAVVILSVACYLIMAAVADNRGLCDSFTICFSPRCYFNPYLPEVPSIHWVAFFSPIVVLLLFRLLSLKPLQGKWWKCCILSFVLWGIVCSGLVGLGHKYYNERQQFLWELSDKAFRSDWDGILSAAYDRGALNNDFYLNFVNLALAHKGTLGEDAFRCMPNGASSLLMLQGEGFINDMMRSDIDYVTGNVASAQSMAFESLSFAQPRFKAIRPLIRLLQTNIIQGHYEVAEKYIAMLDHTLYYKELAQHYRSLCNDEAVMNDLELGRLRSALPLHNRFIMLDGWYPEMNDILQTDSTNTIAATYIGLSYLFSKNMNGFQQFIEQYKDIPALSPMPSLFQQAIIILFQQDETVWPAYHVSEQTIAFYQEFRSSYLQNRGNRNLANLMRQKFGHTVWYYMMFKK